MNDEFLKTYILQKIINKIPTFSMSHFNPSRPTVHKLLEEFKMNKHRAKEIAASPVMANVTKQLLVLHPDAAYKICG